MCSPIEITETVLECCKQKEAAEDLPFFSCSPEMDASGGGPDSGLDTSSTGCPPGGDFSSPREHTVSETSGVDLTEAAIGEDMPHDGDEEALIPKPTKSSASSSVSSEAGTWDSTFPPSNSDNAQEQNTEEKTDTVKTLAFARDQKSEYDCNDDSCGVTVDSIEKLEPGATEQSSISAQETSSVSEQQSIDCSEQPLSLSSLVEAVGKPEDEENLFKTLTPEPKYCVSGILSGEKSEPCEDFKEAISNASKGKPKKPEIEEISVKCGQEQTTDHVDLEVDHESEESDCDKKLKNELETDYVETKFIPGLYSSYSERCSDWWLEPSPHSSLGSQNYFIDAASLVDESEVCVPPFQISKSDEVEKETKENNPTQEDTVTATPHSSPIRDCSKFSVIAKPKLDNVTIPLANSQDFPAVLMEKECSPESENVIECIQKQDSDAAVKHTDEVLSVSAELYPAKYTHLKPSTARIGGQDSYAEFEKELKLIEHLTPQVAFRKLHGEGMRRRWDSCSEEMLSGRQLSTVDILPEICKSDLDILSTVSMSVDKENIEGYVVTVSSHKLQKFNSESLKNNSKFINSETAVPWHDSYKQNQTFTVSKLDAKMSEESRHDKDMKNYSPTNSFQSDTGKQNFLPETDSAEILVNGSLELQNGNEVPTSEGKSNTGEELPRPSLIRRNTFELDPDDDHLALLRQEYERRQGNLVFQSHIPQFSGHLTGSEGFRDPQSMIMVGSDLTAEGIMTEYMQTSHMSAPSLLLESSNLLSNVQGPAFCNSSSVMVDSYLTSSTRIQVGEVREIEPMVEHVVADVIVTEDFSVVPVKELSTSIDIIPNYESEKLESSEMKYFQKQEITNSEECSDNMTAHHEEHKDSQKHSAVNYDSNSKPVVSGALTFSDIIDEKKSWESPKKQKRTESTPIVSGGVSTVDFSTQPRKVNDSPVLSRRRNELAPILSGAAPALSDISLATVDPRPPQPVPAKAAWVVDMSDCTATVTKKPPLDFRRRRKSDISVSNVNAPGSPEKNEKSPLSGGLKEDGPKLDMDEILPQENRIQKSASASSVKSSGLGFFVDLSENKAEEVEKRASNPTDIKTHSSKLEGKSCGYFVGLGKEESEHKKEGAAIVKQHSADEAKEMVSEKKNLMFSMFIDIGAPKQEVTQKPNIMEGKVAASPSSKRKTSQTLKGEDNSKHGAEIEVVEGSYNKIDSKHAATKGTYMYIDASLPPEDKESSNSLTDKKHKDMPEKKAAVFMFIESDSPVTRRKTLPSGLRPTFNRHSWNPETEERAVTRKQHKRAHSLSVDRNSVSTSSEEKSSSASSLSKSRMQSSSQSLTDDSHIVKHMSTSCHGRLMTKTYEKFVKRSLSSEGNSESEINTITEEKNISEKSQEGTENADVKQTQSIVVKQMQKSDLSVAENNLNRTFYLSRAESENTSSEKNISSSSHGSDVEYSSGSGEKRLQNSLYPKESKSKLGHQKSNSDTTDRYIVKENEIGKDFGKAQFKEVDTKSTGSFVKLSDLDKEPETKADSCSLDSLPSFSTTTRMTRSIPETSWIENKLLMSRSIGSGTTSKSLSRLFPHLHSATNSSTSPKTGHSKSPSSGHLEGEDTETQVSETSELSSMQSSMGPSGLDGSTEETDASSSYAGRSAPVSRLGEDLLRMFIEEINPDVTVEVGGRRIKAHKCILSSRCQYFAAMLSGGWVESAGNVISLQGFSYKAVHFALCHIYSGASNIPDTISIIELATLADMLGLEGLKEVIMYTLKVKYCHFFHKPCSMCAVGVLECLPLAAAYGLDDIYRKSLKWITKHFVKIWPTKGFATLPRELIEKCFQQHVVHMTTDNVLETITACDKLLATIPNVRWAEGVFSLTSQLLDASIKFMANHFSGLLTSDSFLSLAKDSSWNISQLEDSLIAATDRLPPDQCCQSYAHLHHILSAAKSSDPQSEVQWSSVSYSCPLPKDGCSYQYKVRFAKCGTTEWPGVTKCFLELLERLQKRVEASLVRQAPRAARSPSWLLMEPDLQRKIQETACLVLVPGDETHRSRHSSVPARHISASSSGSRSLDLRQVKLAMTQQARRAASGGRVSALRADSSSTSRKQQQQQQQPVQQSQQKPHTTMQVAHTSRSGDIKTQESKQKTAKQKHQSGSCAATPEKVTTASRRPGRTISSSDSSRTSSPAMKRAAANTDNPGKNRTFTAGTTIRGVSGTSPGSDAKNRRKKEGEFSMSVDSLSELTTNSTKIQSKEVGEGIRSKNNAAVHAEVVFRRKRVVEDVTISTDSLSESGAVPERLKRPEVASQSAPNVTRPDTPKDRRHHALGRIGTDVTMSTDSLATTESFVVENVTNKTNNGKSTHKTPFIPASNTSVSRQDPNKVVAAKGMKVNTNRTESQQSPLPAIRKTANRQAVHSPRDSPTARLRSGAASSPFSSSPSLRRNLLHSTRSSPDNVSSTNNNSKTTPPSKSVVQLRQERVTKTSSSAISSNSSNRRTSPRLQTKNQLSSPAKASSENKSTAARNVLRDTGSPLTVNKSVSNVNKVNNNVTKKTVNGVVGNKSKGGTDSVTPTKAKVDTKKGGQVEDKPPTVGSRSGTFLKDEPTILKKPDIDNVQE